MVANICIGSVLWLVSHFCSGQDDNNNLSFSSVRGIYRKHQADYRTDMVPKMCQDYNKHSR